MPAVIFLACLDLEQKSSFMDGHLLVSNYLCCGVGGKGRCPLNVIIANYMPTYTILVALQDGIVFPISNTSMHLQEF